jgi:phosphinothricin acetyltransferase
MDIKLKPMSKDNQKEIIDIFNYYIENSFAAYPEKRVPYNYFERFLAMCKGYPAVIAEDDSGTVVGFGMLRMHSPVPTFSSTAEITYFIKPGSTGKGIGSMMLDHLVREGKKKGLTSLLASISSLNEGSINFHRNHGFIECGRFKKICKKRGTVFDIVYMQKML